MEAPQSADSQIHWRLKSWFPDLNEQTHALLKTYFVELIKHNKIINLISSKSINNCDGIYFADCIEASKIVHKNINSNEYLYDIGSGNGFPGIVYSILYPDQKVILIELEERKCDFLRHAISVLKLPNITVVNKKIESYAQDSIGQAICRGFSPLPKTLMTLRKIVRVGGTVFHLKSSEWSMEVSQIPIQLCSSWQPILLGEYKLPIGDIHLFLVKTDKIN